MSNGIDWTHKFTPCEVDAFLRDLTGITNKHGITINGCGCCGSPFLGKVHQSVIRYADNGASDPEDSVGRGSWLRPIFGENAQASEVDQDKSPWTKSDLSPCSLSSGEYLVVARNRKTGTKVRKIDRWDEDSVQWEIECVDSGREWEVVLYMNMPDIPG